MMLKAKQKGFTLLELLVVITLLAILSVGALVAYEGIGDTAQATAAANNTAKTDQAIRNFKAVTQNYPDQWDSLVTTAGAAPAFLEDETTAAFMNLPLPVSGAANDFRDRIDQAFDRVGVEEIQIRTQVAATPGVEPNLQHNEGAVAPQDANYATLPDVDEVGFPTLTNLAILPTFGTAACSVNGTAIPVVKLDTTTTVSAADGQRQNAIHDALEEDECNLVVAMGFGHDAAHSTNGSSVAISTAPTYVSKNINPTASYARYVALFHVGQDGAAGATADDIEAAEIFERPRLIAVLDTEGRAIDQNIADATNQDANN